MTVLLKTILRYICLISCLTGSLLASEFRKFTDTKGRVMNAKITNVSGVDVYIERDDGMMAKVNLQVFSEADQEYIQQWALTALLDSDVFDIRFSRQSNDENEYNNKGVIYNEYNFHYDVVIKNNDYDNDFKNVKVEYLILKFEDALAAKKKSEGVSQRIKGTVMQDVIPAREEVRVSTETIPMLESQLAPGFVWKNGGKRDSKDVIEGIWVKVYVGDKLVTEKSRPDNMMRRSSWN